MENNGDILFICDFCGKPTPAPRSVLRTMYLLELKRDDFVIRCKECQLQEYYNLIKFVERVCHE